MAESFERPFVPVDLAQQAAATFPLQDMIEQLRGEDVFRDSNRNALTLVHDDDLTAVLTVAKEGTQCADHAAPEPTIVVNMSGKLEIRGSSGGGVIQLVDGSAAVLAPSVEHKLAAITDCAYLLIIGGSHKTQV